MKHQLSSILTLPYKLLVLLLACTGLYWIVFHFDNTNFPGAVVYFILIGFLWYLVGRYKRVLMDDRALYISNYLREIKVPLADIEQVDGPNLWSRKVPEIVITLRSPCYFGDTIRFVPKYFSAGAIAAQLRKESPGFLETNER